MVSLVASPGPLEVVRQSVHTSISGTLVASLAKWDFSSSSGSADGQLYSDRLVAAMARKTP
jgi:hypothetical protein